MRYFILILLNLVTINVYSQVINFDFPQKQDTNIAIDSKIYLSVSYPFVLDTNINLRHHDTLLIDNPIVDFYIYEENDNDGSDSSKIQSMTYNFPQMNFTSDTTMELSYIQNFDYDEKHGILIKNFQMVNKLTLDTFSVDTLIEDYFTTQLPPIKLIYTNAMNTELNCSDTIFVDFNRPLTSTLLDSIFVVNKKNFIIDTLNDSLTLNFEKIPTNISLFNDNMSASIVPTSGFESGTPGLLEVNLSFETADTNDNYQFNFLVTNALTLHLKSNNLSGPVSSLPENCEPENAGTYFIKEGVKWVFDAPKIVGNYYLESWDIDNYIDSMSVDSNSGKISVVFGCGELEETTITANYALIPLDTIKTPEFFIFENDTLGRFCVTGFLDSLGGGTYTYKRYGVPPIDVCICANPFANVEVGYWTSNDSSINNSNTSCITFTPEKRNYKTGGGMPAPPRRTDVDVVGGGYQNYIMCQSLSVKVKIIGYENDTPPNNIAAICSGFGIKVGGNTYPFVITNDVDGASGYLTANIPGPFTGEYLDVLLVGNIIDNHYEIADVNNADITNTKWGTPHVYKGAFASGIFSKTIKLKTTAGNCENNLTLRLREKRVYLDIQTTMLNQEELPNENVVRTNPYYNNSLLSYRIVGMSELINTTKSEKILKNNNSQIYFRRVVYEIKHNSEIKIAPFIKEGKGFVFKEWNCNSPFSCSPISSDEYSQNTLYVTMDNDKDVQAIYESDFHIIWVGVVNPDNHQEIIKYETQNMDDGMEHQMSELDRPQYHTIGYTVPVVGKNRRTGFIQYYFNKPVDPTTLVGCNVIYDYTAIKEGKEPYVTSRRLDGEGLEIRSANQGDFTISNLGGGSLVTYTLNGNPPHMSQIKHSFFPKGVKSTLGYSLNQNERAIDFIGTTQWPVMKIKLKGFRFKTGNSVCYDFGSDWDLVFDILATSKTIDGSIKNPADYSFNDLITTGSPKNINVVRTPLSGNIQFDDEESKYITVNNDEFYISNLAPFEYLGIGWGVVEVDGSSDEPAYNPNDLIDKIVNVMGEIKWGGEDDKNGSTGKSASTQSPALAMGIAQIVGSAIKLAIKAASSQVDDPLYNGGKTFRQIDNLWGTGNWIYKDIPIKIKDGNEKYVSISILLDSN